jgi:putative ATP-dependent endonuclease of OLD family
MLLRRIVIENVRSFLDRAELTLEGPITIVIGPNGGGKTNLLDVAVILLRRYLFASMYPVHAPTPEQPDRHEFRENDALNNMQLERHSNGAGKPQLVEVEIEVTQRDCDNMRAMKDEAVALTKKAEKKYANLRIQRAADWHLEHFVSGARFAYRWNGNSLETSDGPAAEFQQYMNNFEVDSLLRAEFEVAPLATPMVYLPVNRSLNTFQSSVELSGYNDFEQKRHNDASISRTSSSIVPLAIGRLAQKYRMLLEKDVGGARADFKSEANLRELTKILGDLGYEWDLECTNPLKNSYDIRLKKQGSSFLVGAASSGERELLTYLFAIFALNVRDALIVVDEPELHLHPRWQKTLLQLFARLAISTGNQFLLATHSPTFVSPDSIQFVSRVFSRGQRSHILRLTTASLPDAKHLLNIVNSQNNEGIFFADEVVLVEGLSDRIFFEAVLDRLGRGTTYKSTLEVVSVGGKGLFKAYGKLLSACQVPYSIIADRDFLEEIAPSEIKSLFKVDEGEIKRDVIDNMKSADAKALVDRIEEALASQSWRDAQETWTYIKSRRRRLRGDLTAAEKANLQAAIISKYAEQIYVLREGSLEAYLPEGFRGKDMDKLIGFIASDGFWSNLSSAAQHELRDIARRLMPAA